MAPRPASAAHSAVLLCVSLLTVAPASAHHSFAKFDRQRSIELEGELVEVRWQNPHVTFELRGRGPDGQVQTWQLETNSPGILRRAGVGPELVAVGDRVKVAGNPAVDGSLELNATHMLLPDGREMQLGFGGAPRFAGRTVGDARAWMRHGRRQDASGARPVSRLELDVCRRGRAVQRSRAADAASTTR